MNDDSVAKVAASPSSAASPVKARLLWRGALHLADGTALPGIAIVSTVQPAFPSAQQRSGGSLLGDRQEASTVEYPPLCLSAEAQDDLCLSIEMVRHAPLQILDTIQSVAQGDDGRLYVAPMADAVKENGANRDINSSAAKHGRPSVSFEAGGHVRLYIDPSQDSTLAFFERLFGDDEGVPGPLTHPRSKQMQLQSSVSSTQNPAFTCASAVLVFSLDKSITKVYTAESTLDDVASDPLWRNGAAESGYWASSRTSLAGLSGACGSNPAMEAVVIAVKRYSESETRLELHVGRNIVRKPAASAEAQSSGATLAAGASMRNSSLLAARPDDPAPRTFGRMFARTLSRGNLASKTIAPTRVLHAKKRNGDFAMPKPPQHGPKKTEGDGACQGWPSKGVDGTSREYGSSEAGKRASPRIPDGDLITKRSRSSSSDMGTTKGAQSNYALAQDERTQRKESSGEDVGAARKPAVPAPQPIEERNRSLVKKLVHHQLLGKGIERGDDAYLACFGPTCQGALVALRHVAKTQAIDRQQAVFIIERHLELYL